MSINLDQERKNLFGIIFMLINAVSIAVLYTAVKELRTELDSNLIVFLYKFSILILILPWVFKDGLKGLRTKKFYLHALRGFLSISGSLCLFFAIKFIELSDITAIGYLEQVLLVLVGVLIFKEASTVTKYIAVAMSFLGAMVVVYPEVIQFSEYGIPYLTPRGLKGDFNEYYIFVFLSILFWGSNCVVIKLLGRTEETRTQMFYVLLFSCIYAYPLAFLDWVEQGELFAGIPYMLPVGHHTFGELELATHHLPYLALLALCYFIHSIAFYKALTYSEFSVVIPFDYSRLIFAGIFGYLFYQETPEFGSYFGYLLIIASGVVLVRSEKKRMKRQKLKDKQIMELEEEYEHA